MKNNESTENLTHVMIDIETLGLTPGAMILTIGAVSFTKYGIVDKLLLKPHRTGHIEYSTVKWWLSQSKEAQDAAFLASPSELLPWGDLFHALSGFVGDSWVWSNGANFDVVHLRHWMNSGKNNGFGGYRGWSPFKERCYRTIKESFNAFLPTEEELPRTNAHNAVADAEYQAYVLLHLYAQGVIKL